MDKKPFDNIQHSFLVKVKESVGMERVKFSPIKAIYDKPKSNIILNRKKYQDIPFNIRNKTKMFTFSTHFQYIA